MAKYRKKPVVIEATVWNVNGDHPEDDCKNDEEGKVVRRYRSPDIGKGSLDVHLECGFRYHYHGWIDTLEGGHVVCPGDFIITGVEGEHYPCKPRIFIQTYDEVTG